MRSKDANCSLIRSDFGKSELDEALLELLADAEPEEDLLELEDELELEDSEDFFCGTFLPESRSKSAGVK